MKCRHCEQLRIDLEDPLAYCSTACTLQDIEVVHLTPEESAKYFRYPAVETQAANEPR